MENLASVILATRVAAVVETHPTYPTTPPYHPNTVFPEYPFRDIAQAFTQEPNYVYAGVRELLRVLGFDESRYGTPEWNPLSTIISPDQTVLLKPN